MPKGHERAVRIRDLLRREFQGRLTPREQQLIQIARGAGKFPPAHLHLGGVPGEIASRTGAGLVEMVRQPASELIQAGRAIASARELEPSMFLRQPSLLGEAAAGTAADIGRSVLGAGRLALAAGPEIVGGIGGGLLTGTPMGAAGGAALMRGATTTLGQLLARQPDPAEALAQMGTTLAMGALPPGAAAVGKRAIGTAARRAPGAAPALHEYYAAGAKRLPETIRGEPSGPLYAAVERQVGGIQVPRLVRAIEDVLTREERRGKALGEPGPKAAATELGQVIQEAEGGVPLVNFQVLRERLSALGKRGRALEEDNPTAAGEYKHLYSAGWKDLERAADLSPLLKQANRAYRKEMAAETLRDWIEGTPTRKGAIEERTADALVRFSPGKLLDKIRRDEFFRDSIAPRELESITAFLHEAATAPSLPPVRGAARGTALAFVRTSTAGGLTYALTGSPGAAATVGGIAASVPEIMSRALMTEPGRRLLRGMLVTGTTPIMPETLQALAVAGTMFGRGEEESPR